MPGTVLLGIDVETANECSSEYAKHGLELFHQLGIPVTFFLTGQVIDLHPEVWAEAEKDELIHLEAHTYNHILLKTVCMKIPPGKEIHDSRDYFLREGASPEQIEEDLSRCVKSFTDVIGRPPVGLTGPWGYYRGLQDRPDLLKIVAQKGFKFVRMFARDEWDGQPVPLKWQPFFYAPQGCPDILECMIHDYQDEFYWDIFTSPRSRRDYIGHLKLLTDIVVMSDCVWSAASHDHRCDTKEGFEQRTNCLKEWIKYAKDCGVRFLSYQEYYDEKTGAITHAHQQQENIAEHVRNRPT